MRRLLVTFVVIAALASQSSLAGGKIDGNGMLFYMKGSFFEARQDMMHAYAYYLQADKYQPDNPVIILALARVTYDIKKYDETLGYADRLLGLGGHDGEAKLIVAEVALRQGDSGKALGLFEEIKDEDGVPKLEVRKLMARIYLETNETGKALKILEEAKAIDPQDLYTNYRLGFLYAEGGEVDKAIESFERAAGQSPDITGVHLALASMFLRKGDAESAKRSFRDAIRIEPGNRDAVNSLADLYYEEGELSEGVALLEPYYADKDLDQEGKKILGKTYYRLEEYDKALEIFQNMLKSEPDNPTLFRVVAEIEVGNGNFRSSVEYLKRLIELEPGNFDNYTGLLLIAFDFAGDPSGPDEVSPLTKEDGRRYLKKASGLVDFDSVDDNYFIGTIYKRLKEYDKASDYLLRARELGPEDDRILLELAELFLHYKRFEDAIEIARGLYEKDPDSASMSNFYGYLLAEAGEQLELAEQLLTDALRIEPGNGYFLDSMAWIKYRQQKYAKALEIMLEALALVDDDAVMWEHIGDIYVKLEMYAKAKEAYSRSISIDSLNSGVRQKLLDVSEALPREEK